MSYQQVQQADDPALIPCDHVLHPLCIVEGNPEHWPVLGGLVTRLTDLIGDIIRQPVTNGWYGFLLLVAIIISASMLAWKYQKKKIKGIYKKLKKSI